MHPSPFTEEDSGSLRFLLDVMDGKMSCKLNDAVHVGPLTATDRELLISPAKLDPLLRTPSVPSAPEGQASNRQSPRARHGAGTHLKLSD